MALGQAVINIIANVKNAMTGISQVQRGVTGLGATISGIGSKMLILGASSVALTAALGGIFAPVIIQGAKFEKTMAGVRAVVADLGTRSGTSIKQANDNFALLTNQVRKLGETSGFSAQQVAEAAFELGRAGLDAVQTMEALPAVLSLAAAGSLSLANAAEIASDAMNAFGLSAGSVSNIADVLVLAANASTTSVEAIGESFKYASPLAAALGQSMEETATALALLANAGLKGSTAGTGLSQILNQLALKGEEANAVLQKYGLTFEQVNPSVVSLTDIILRFQSAGVSAADAMDLFGIRAGRAFLALQNAGVGALAKMTDAMNNRFGVAAEQQFDMLNNVSGAWIKFKGAVGELGLTLFDTMKSDLKSILESLIESVHTITDWVSKNKEMVGAWITFAAKVAAVTLALGAFAIAAGIAAKAIGAVVIALTFMKAQGVATVLKLTGALKAMAAINLSTTFSSLLGLAGAGGKLKALWASLRTGVLILGGLKLAAVAAGGALLVGIGAAIGVVAANLGLFGKKARSTVREFFGMKKDAEELKEMARIKKMKEDAAKDDAKFLDYQSEVLRGLNEEAGIQEQILELQEKRDSLNATELMRLSELLELNNGSVKALDSIAIRYEAQLIDVQKLIEKRKEQGLATTDLERREASLKAMVEEQNKKVQRAVELEKEMGHSMNTSSEDARKSAEALKRRTEILEAGAAAVEVVIEAEKEMIKINQEILASLQSENQQAIDQIQELINLENEHSVKFQEGIAAQREAQAQLIRDAEAQIDTAHEIIKSDKESLTAKKIAAKQIDENTAKIKASKEEIARLTSKFDEGEARSVQSQELLEQQKLDETKKQAKARTDFLREQEIKVAQERGDIMRAAQLESQKFLDEEKERREEVFATTSAMSDEEKKLAEEQKARAEAGAEQQANMMIVKAQKEMVEQKKKQAKENDDLLKAENKAVDNVTKHVKGVAQLVHFYRVLGNLRKKQEQEALEASTKFIRSRETIQRLEDKLLLDPSNTKLQSQLKKAKDFSQIFAGLADTKLVKAGGTPQFGEQFKVVDPITVESDLAKAANALTKFKLDLDKFFDDTTIMWKELPDRWANAFVTAWANASITIKNAITQTMADIKFIMKPTTKLSPSLVDIWNANADVVKYGVEKMQQSINQGALGISNLNVAGALPGVGISGSAANIGPRRLADNLNDNRRVEIVVNNRFDAEEVQRKVGRALLDGGFTGGAV
jgi:TP901 family phage tail tape measure protein